MSQIRIHQSVLVRAERVAIDWILPRLPAATTPDKLTAFGTFGAALTCLGYGLCGWSAQYLWLANLGLLIHWFGDSLDGNLARYRRIERPRYGYFLDQTIDVVGNFLICFGLGLSPYVDMRVALVALAGYHMVSIYVFVRAAIMHDFHVSLAYMGPTELRALLVFTNLCILVLGVWDYRVLGVNFTWVDLSVSCFALAFMISFAVHVMRFAPVLRDMDDQERMARQAAAPQVSDQELP
jgi:archaetidylinositol phosphate synthase